MKLNSFCVIVSYHAGVIHHERPMKFDEAHKKYSQYINRYFVDRRNATMIGGAGNISDEMIEEQVRKWKGNVRIISHWILGFRCTSEQRGFRVELMHSSQS